MATFHSTSSHPTTSTNGKVPTLAHINRCTCSNPEVDSGRHPFASLCHISIRSMPLLGHSRYGRDDNGFIRDDHRSNGQSRRAHKSLTPTRNGKQVKSPKTKGANNQHKRRNSRQRKQRNQNSKTEGQSNGVRVRSSVTDLILFLGTPLINGTDLKLTMSHETNDDDKHKHDSVHHLHTEQPLAPRDHDHKENDS